MKRQSRPGFTLFQLLTLLAALFVGFSLFLPALAKAKLAAARVQSQNNLQQICLAAVNYSSVHKALPPGCDANGFSAATYVLPYIEQQNVYNMIDLKKPVDDKANAPARGIFVKTFLSPLDPVTKVKDGYGPTNYLFNAGSKADLQDDDGVFYLNSKIDTSDITDGTSLTLLAVETLKGDGKANPESPTVQRDYVLLTKDALKGIKDDAGAAYFKDKKDLAADRCASWMDGRFLQGTFNSRLKLNDPRPDVSCGGLGGVSSMRGGLDSINTGMCDGSVRFVSRNVSLQTWRAASTRNGGEVLGADW